MFKSLIGFLVGAAALVFVNTTFADTNPPLVRNNKGKILLNVYECDNSMPDLSKWRVYQTMEYLNEDGSGERTILVIDPERKLGLGMLVDLIHKDGSIEPMMRISGLSTANEATAYLKNGKWLCFSGTASWLTVSGKDAKEKVAIYYVAEDKDDSKRKVEIYKWESARILGKILIWNWQPPKDMHDGKKKYSDAPEIELASWAIKN